MVAIIQKGNQILRKRAKEIAVGKIKSMAIQNIIKKMHVGIATRNDAVAIAAPQLGYSLRMFMVSRKVFITEEENKNVRDMIFINPILTKISRKKMQTDEGCLSVDTWYGKTKRAEKVTLRAYNEKGKRIERGASGLLAQIFQHEVDHLNGILFTDHATDLVQLQREQEAVDKKR